MNRTTCLIMVICAVSLVGVGCSDNKEIVNEIRSIKTNIETLQTTVNENKANMAKLSSNASAADVQAIKDLITKTGGDVTNKVTARATQADTDLIRENTLLTGKINELQKQIDDPSRMGSMALQKAQQFDQIRKEFEQLDRIADSVLGTKEKEEQAKFQEEMLRRMEALKGLPDTVNGLKENLDGINQRMETIENREKHKQIPTPETVRQEDFPTEAMKKPLPKGAHDPLNVLGHQRVPSGYRDNQNI